MSVISQIAVFFKQHEKDPICLLCCFMVFFQAPCDRKIRVQFFGVTIDCFGDVCSNYVELNGGNWAQAGPRLVTMSLFLPPPPPTH